MSEDTDPFAFASQFIMLTTLQRPPIHNFSQLYQNQLIKIMGQNTKTSRTLKFIKQFSSEHQLVCRTQQYCIYDHKGKIVIQ